MKQIIFKITKNKLLVVSIITLIVFLLGRVQKSECDSIEDSKKKDLCWAQISKLKNDTSGCEKITDKGIKYGCYTLLVYYNSKIEPDICLKLSETYRTNCLIMVAVSKDDIGFCKNLPEIEANDCYGIFAFRHKDPSFCDKIVSSYKRDDCYEGSVFYIKSGTQCDKINDNFKRDNCYSKAAYETNNTKFCEKIEGPIIEKDSCYHRIALQKKNRPICDMIKNQSFREDCYSEVI